MKRLTLYFAIAMLFSCTRKNGQDDGKLSADNTITSSDGATTTNDVEMDNGKLDNYLTREEPDTTSVQSITSDCAVIIYPTDDQIDELTRENGEEDFATIADDSNYYQIDSN